MITRLVTTPLSLAQHLAVGAVRGGVGVATALLDRVLPGGEATQAPAPAPAPEREPEPSAPVDITPPTPDVDPEPITQPPTPEPTPTPGATTTLADPAPATATPATAATARKATARKGPAKRTASAPKTPTKPASTLDEPLAPVDDDPIVYSSGPDA